MNKINAISTAIAEKMTIIPKFEVFPSIEAIRNNASVAILVVELAIPFTSPRFSLGISSWRNSVSPILNPYRPMREKRINTKKM